jgi:hypothetical protein
MSLHLMQMHDIVLAVASAPFPTAESTPTVTQSGANSAVQVLKSSRDAGALATKQLSYLWDMFTKSDGLFWLILYKSINPLLVVGFACWAMKAGYDWNVSGSKHMKKEQYLSPFLVAIMVANNGMLMSFGIQATNLIPKNINDGILNTAIKGVTGRQVIQQGLAASMAAETFANKTRSCIDQKNKAECKAQAEKDAQAIAEANNPDGNPINPNDLAAGEVLKMESGGIFPNAGAIAMQGIRLGMTAAIIGVLTTLSYASHLVFGLIQTMWAGMGLIFLGLHLIPGAWNLKVFFSGFLGISVAIIFNSAWQVSTSIMLASAAEWDPLILPLLNGFIGPLASLALAYLGITGAFQLIGNSVGGVARVIRRK